MRSPRDPVLPRHDGASVVAASRPVRWTFCAMLLIAGAIHLMPLIGIAGSDPLHRLYALRFDDPGTLLLMRHRALLFGLLGAGLLAAIRFRAWRTPMLVGGIASTAGFLALAFDAGTINAALTRVVIADVVALAALLVAALLATKLESTWAPSRRDRAPDRSHAWRSPR